MAGSGFWTRPSSAPTTKRKAEKRKSAVPARPKRTTRTRRDVSPIAQRALEAQLALRTKQRIARAEGRDEGGGGVLGAIGDFVGGGLGLGENLLKGVIRAIPGLSRQVYEGSKASVGMGAAASPSLVTEALGYRPSFRESAKSYGNLAVDNIVAPVDMAKYFLGPLAEGKYRLAAERAYDDPLGAIGVASLAYGGAGAGLGAALRQGGRLTRGTRIGAAAERAGSKQTSRRDGSIFPEDGPMPPRQRPVQQIVDPVTKSVVTRQPPPRSSNPMTRAIQRRVLEPASRGAKAAFGKIPMGGKNPLSPSNRFQRVSRKGASGITYGFGTAADNATMIGTEAYQFAVRQVPRKLGRKAGKPAYAATALRAMGLNNISSRFPDRTWGRDSLIREWELERAKTGGDKSPERLKVIDENIDTLRQIPDEWLDPATAPPVLNRLVKETESVLRESTNAKLAAGTISKQTAELSARRAQYQAAGVFSTYLKAQEAAAEATQIGGQIKALQERAAQRTVAGKSTQDIDANIAKLKSKQKKRTAEAEKGRRSADAAIGPEMSPGVYFPQRQRTPIQKTVRQSTAPGATAQMRLATEPQNKGAVMREGSPAFSPDVVLYAVRSGNDAVFRREALTAIFNRYSIKDADGNPISGERATAYAKDYPNKYVVVSRQDFEKMVQGERMSDDAARMFPNEAAELSRLNQQALKVLEDMDSTPFLIPKSVRDEWHSILGLRNKPAAYIDEFYSYWKGGVLALSPRWYIQNIFGNSLMFALGAGLDMQAISMAFHPTYRKQVMADMAAHGISSDLGSLAIKSGMRPDGNILARSFKRVVTKGYQINNRFESVYRRAMFWHVAKKKIKEENLAKSGSAADLSDAWLTVANAAKNGESWALRLADDIRIESTRFLGEYVRFNRFERGVMRRVYPFYAWMRTITRLALALPVKHPKRASLLSISSQMAFEMYGDEESELLDPYSGLIDGDMFIQTNVLMPQESLSPMIAGLGRIIGTAKRGDIGRIPGQIGKEALVQGGPLVGLATEITQSRNLLGIPRINPEDPEIARDFSGRSFGIDALTDQPDDVILPPSLESYFEQYFPVVGAFKRYAAGLQPDERLGTDTDMIDILRYRLGNKRKEDIMLPRPLDYGGEPIERSAFTELTGMFAATPIYKYNPKSAAARKLLTDQRAAEAFISSYRRRLKNKALLNRP